jgi:hypothetical protein
MQHWTKKQIVSNSIRIDYFFSCVLNSLKQKPHEKFIKDPKRAKNNKARKEIPEIQSK